MPKPIKVLVIGRHADMLSRVNQLLEANGYTAYGATENEEALSLFKQNNPDAVIIGGGVDVESRQFFKAEFSKINPHAKMIDGHPNSILHDLRVSLEN